MTEGDPLQDQVVIQNATLRGNDFTGHPARRWVIAESNVEGCRFEDMRIDYFCFGAGRKMSEYVDCSFDGSRISAITPGCAKFIRCSFRNVRLRNWICLQAEFLDCVFSGTLAEINFDARLIPVADRAELGRSRNRYVRNDFSDATLRHVAFKGGVDLLEQRLPQGDGYVFLENAETVIRAALTRVGMWPESREKKHASAYLEVELDYVEGGQRQLLISPHDFTSRDGSQERAFQRLMEIMAALRENGSVARGGDGEV